MNKMTEFSVAILLECKIVLINRLALTQEYYEN